MKWHGIPSAFMFMITLLLIWLCVSQKYLQEGAKCELQNTDIPRSKCTSPGLFESHPGCCAHKVCPADHYSFFLRSGVANVVGPKICFDNKIIMGESQNNVGWGLNIVLVKGETGEVLRRNYFNRYSRGLHAFLKMIQAGNIILVASYEDPTVMLTDEIREIFAGMGSTVIHSVRYRDNWVHAGAAGMNKQSVFEKLIASDEKTNAYGDWPEMVEVDGCFPRKI